MVIDCSNSVSIALYQQSLKDCMTTMLQTDKSVLIILTLLKISYLNVSFGIWGIRTIKNVFFNP